MTGLFILGGIWAGFTVVVVRLVLTADREMQADLPDVREPHDPADCGACAVAADATMTRFDLTLWSIEMEGAL